MKCNYSILLLLLLVVSCQPELDYKTSGYVQKIIVEGYISNNEYPKVYLTLNIPLSEKVDSISILNNVIRYAKVTVSDSLNPNVVEAKTEILTSGWETDKRLFPPYKYFGRKYKGEEGKKYYLTVEYGGFTLKAQTTIPLKTPIKNFSTKPVNGNDTLKSLFMTIDINPTLKNSYRVYSLKKKDGYYKETQLLYNSKFILSGTNTFGINPTVSKIDSSYSEGENFVKGDTVFIRLCTLDSVSTDFFSDLTLFSSSQGMGNNLLIGEKESLKSNISYPGFGIWYGNGVSTYRIIIP
ncbi:MAG: hypothetical protein PHS59_03990 [Paludibacter sp.]|nr:hypothetical protein [Paludibacter sp.]